MDKYVTFDHELLYVYQPILVKYKINSGWKYCHYNFERQGT